MATYGCPDGQKAEPADVLEANKRLEKDNEEYQKIHGYAENELALLRQNRLEASRSPGTRTAPVSGLAKVEERNSTVIALIVSISLIFLCVAGFAIRKACRDRKQKEQEAEHQPVKIPDLEQKSPRIFPDQSQNDISHGNIT